MEVASVLDKTPIDTTDTILEKLQASPFENVVIHVESMRFLIPVATLKLLAWNSVPDLIKDENSEEAQKHQTLRIGIKALLRPLLPEVLRKTWGHEVAILPRLNILSFLPTYMIHFLINAIATKGWKIHVEKCSDCGENVFKVVGISPNTIDKPATPEASTHHEADTQSLQGRGQPDAYRQEDSNLARGSVGNSGRTEVGEVNIQPGTIEGTKGGIPGATNVHSRLIE
jgi:hypothetical protein